MFFNAQKILSSSETPGEWIEIQTEDGPATLRSYDPSLIEYESVEEQREAKEQEAIERFSDLLRERTGSDTNDFAMSMSIVRFYKAYKAGETPATLEELESLGDLAEQKIYEIRTAEDPESVELP